MKLFLIRVVRLLFPIMAVIILGFMAYWWGVLTHGSPKSIGELSDLVNVPNTLFSGLALIGVVYSFFIQNDEMKKTTLASIESNEALKTQLNQQQKMIELQILTTLLSNESEKVDRVDRWNDNEEGNFYSNKNYRENCKNYEEKIKELEKEIFKN